MGAAGRPLKPLPPGLKRRFTARLLRWFDQNRRQYPWRQTVDPYEVLMAEFMLQRTGAGQTVPVYLAFTKAFPSFAHAASASDRLLASVLAPLGRLGRIHQLRRAIDAISRVHHGRIPATEESLLRLPGVGRYTARAVLAFAYGKRAGLFDPNVARVTTRVFGVSSRRPRPHTDPLMWAFVDRLLPRRRVRDFNWALLDLGAKLCVSRAPRCSQCPLTSLCRYYRRRQAA